MGYVFSENKITKKFACQTLRTFCRLAGGVGGCRMELVGTCEDGVFD